MKILSRLNKADIAKVPGELLAKLGEEQLAELAKKKEEYLSDKKINVEEGFARNLSAIEAEVFHSYLSGMSTKYVPVSPNKSVFVSSFDIEKLVIDPSEDSIEKLSSIYQVLSGEKCSIALVFERTNASCNVSLKVSGIGSSTTQKFARRLKSAIAGNFSGAVLSETKTEQFPPPISQEGKDEQNQPKPPRGGDAAGEKKTEDHLLEKEFREKCEKEVNDKTLSISVVSNLATEKSEKFISQSIEKLLDGIVPKGDNWYRLVLLGKPINDCSSYMQTLHEQYTAISPFATVQTQQSLSESAAKMANSSVGIHGGASFLGANVGKGFGSVDQVGLSKGSTTTYTNYAVVHMMELIEAQVKRLEQCKAFGMWGFAAYIVSTDYNTTNNVAHMYASLTQGTTSYLAPDAINSWNNSPANVEHLANILSAIYRLEHPVFMLKETSSDDLRLPLMTDASILVSGRELANSLNFPRKSVPGLPVLQCAAFGRNAISIDGKEISGIELGKIYHMHKPETTPVEIDVDSLTMHTFITGSTGSGKSNTVYHLLKKLKDQGKHFLVVEPAKGEYRDVFGDVDIYGTNPDLSRLLRINPFSFPQGIRVDEHIDRLISIFNVCWPMYAAMPAVLKDSIERAYINAGWDLETSKNKYGRLFPTFIDVLDQIEAVMDESQYSADSKGDYKGALLTRVRSLTNGINGLIFGADELSDEALFNSDVIVDISRVGSPETRSLIMGLLVMKLQEYRTAKREFTDKLVHVTVLEEAHNLLKRTSTEQSDESSNLVGKSVEMLSNAIAEMRAFGEGFIIADQAPGLLDMAAIRNTNTKIILRLPEYSDRALVGRTVGLNDDQIAELAKLKQGVAAVYQNDWVEAVLCQVPKYTERRKYEGLKGECVNDGIKATLINCLTAKDLYRLVDRSNWKAILTANIPAHAKCRLFDYLNAPERDRDEIAAEVAYELLGGSSVVSEVLMKESFREQKKCLLRKLSAKLQEMTDEQFHSILSLVIYWHAHETERPEVKRLAQELLQSECARRVE